MLDLETYLIVSSLYKGCTNHKHDINYEIYTAKVVDCAVLSLWKGEFTIRKSILSRLISLCTIKVYV